MACRARDSAGRRAYRIHIRGTGGERVLEDILVGEVWLASGQSNMAWTLGPRLGNGVLGWEEACLEAEDSGLRVFEVGARTAPAPTRDLQGTWVSADPESAQSFSATAYFFARELRRELGVPVGLIGSYWGGTPAEAWTGAGALASFPEFADELARQARYVANPEAAEAQWREDSERYWLRAYELDASRGLAGAEVDPGLDADWNTVALPATWEQHGLAEFDGLAWYRRDVTLPEVWAGRPLEVELGAIDDRDTVYWNGQRIGGHEQSGQWQKPRHYVVPGESVRAGANLLAVRVLDTGGLGGFASPAEAMRISPQGEEGEPLSLAGEWRWQAGTPLSELGWPPAREVIHPSSPSVLWNGMLAPLVPSAIRGVIWYQGESNVGRAEQYGRLFPALIQDWRAAFQNEALPFYYVQIAPFGYGAEPEAAARLRDAQRSTLALPHTGMAVTLDIGDPKDIHPSRKREVGERLALLALARTYGRELVCSGPLYRSCAPEEGASEGVLRIDFEHAEGLTSRGAPVRHMTIAGADRRFHPAEVRIQEDSLFVWSPAVPEPEAVRFGWGADDETNLWNGAGLPASSFRSDDWQ